MAQNIVGSLFGYTPNDVYDAYAAQDRQAATALMNNPTLAQMGIYYGTDIGQGLGRGVASLLGAEDPRLVQAKVMAEAQQQGFDVTSPEGLKQLAQFFVQRGQPGLASQVAEQAQQMRRLSVEEQLKQAQTVKALQEPQGTEAERARNFLIQVEQRLASGEEVPLEARNKAALILQDMSKPKSFFDPSSGQIITQQGINPLQTLPALSKALQTQPPTGMPASQGTQQTTQQQGGVQQVAPGVTATQIAPAKVDPTIRKEIADTDALITKFDSTFSKMSELSKEIPKLNVSLARNIGRGIESQLGLTSVDQATIDKMQRFINSARNDILLQAKGTQTEGDAQRALDPFINDPTIWRNPQRLAEAWSTLTSYMANNGESLRQKRTTLVPEGANLPSVPSKKQAQQQKPKTSREDAFSKMKAANPNASDASINKWLDGRGY